MLLIVIFVSIHARVKRATSELNADFGTGVVSIHARVKRATSELTRNESHLLFQSTPA